MIADLVAEEQRRNPERRGRRSGEPSKLQDSSPVLSELKLKERQLQDRERALRAREDSLEREWCLGPGSRGAREPAECGGEARPGSEHKNLYAQAVRTFWYF